MNISNEDYSNTIAIIGVTGRFPQISNIQEFWEQLKNGVETFHDFVERDRDVPISHGDFIKVKNKFKDIEYFDASFFGIHPRDAELMDPQLRIFLEQAWILLESAGYNPFSYKGLIGLFASTGLSHYLLNYIYPNSNNLKDINPLQIILGNEKDYLPTYVSYKLNLRGPSLAVQTSCSSSLVSVHLACESLLTYASDMALAGGVNITVPQVEGYTYLDGGLLSRDGHCRSFDDQASGTVYNDGVGIVLLKRMEDALKDGDYIYATIKGSAMNNDGAIRAGYMAPSVDGQREVILRALSHSDVPPETISYIETHGTATPLGDAIELEALLQAYGAQSNKKGVCALGSVKPNIGHTGVVSGVAGLIKVALALKNKTLPPSLNFEEPNEQVRLEDSFFYVNTQLTPWNAIQPLRAGLSSFGLGGTNVHMVLEEAPRIKSINSNKEWHLIPLSAKSQTALHKKIIQLNEYMINHTSCNIADIAYTLQVGRESYDYRYYVICDKDYVPSNKLNNICSDTETRSCLVDNEKTVQFVFPNNICSERNIYITLYFEEPLFRESIDICVEKISIVLNNDMKAIDMLTKWQSKQEEVYENLMTMMITYSLGKLWCELGVHYKSVSGIGIGEITKALFIKDITLDEAIRCIIDSTTLNEKGIVLTKQKNILSKESIDDSTIILIINSGNYLNYLDDEIVEKGTIIGSIDIKDTTSHDITYALIHTLGQLWSMGVPIEWGNYYRQEKRLRIPLPTYPFEREKYWIDNKVSKEKVAEKTEKTDVVSGSVIVSHDDVQETLVNLWKQQFGLSSIAIDDNFFELGGYSLMGTSLVNQINKIFGLDMYLRELFENPTIEELTDIVMNAYLMKIDDKTFKELLQDIE